MSTSPLPPAQQTPTALESLDAAFLRTYQATAADHLTALRQRVPLVLNDFLNLTLYRSNGTTARFQMDKRLYFLMARTSHPPLVLYSIVHRQGYGPLTAATREALADYSELLRAAQAEIETLDVDAETGHRSRAILTRSSAYAAELLYAGQANVETFRCFAADVRPLVKANLAVGARVQLEQFRAQLERWRQEFPDERWEQLRVVILGVHQAREQYATKLFFQWLLQEPSIEQRVVYAEALIPPFGDRREESQRLALDLLAKVDLEHDAATVLLGDETALQRDVMGPAAAELLKSWGTPAWPSNGD